MELSSFLGQFHLERNFVLIALGLGYQPCATGSFARFNSMWGFGPQTRGPEALVACLPRGRVDKFDFLISKCTIC